MLSLKTNWGLTLGKELSTQLDKRAEALNLTNATTTAASFSSPKPYQVLTKPEPSLSSISAIPNH